MPAMPWTMARFDDAKAHPSARSLRHPTFRGLCAAGCGVLHRQCDAGHGHRVADDRAHRLGHPHGAGADRGVPADVPAVAAGRRAGRRDRSAPPAGGCAADAGRAGRAADRCCCWPTWPGRPALLFFTFVTGCCTALLSPAWNTTVADSVPRDELPQAITAVAIAYNGARALGPTLAGVVFAYVGSDWVFGIAVVDHAADVAVDPALAAEAASTVAPAGRAAVGRHAGGIALRAPLATRSLRSCCARWPTAPRARRCGRCCR